MATNASLKAQIDQRDKKPTFSTYICSNMAKKKINEMIGEKEGHRFIAGIVSAVSVNPSLQACSPDTILSGALLGEALKLSPSPQLGQYYLVPFNDKNRECKVAQFILGYKGYIQLAIRSGYYKKINVLAIKEGELIQYDPLNEEIDVNLIEDEKEREEAETIGYYAMFEYNNGFRKAIYWTKAKMEAHALNYSSGYKAKKGSTFWEKDFDGMAYKTMLRQLISKWGIMSIDMQEAITKDMGIIGDNGNTEYIDTNDLLNDENIIEQDSIDEQSDQDREIINE